MQSFSDSRTASSSGALDRFFELNMSFTLGRVLISAGQREASVGAWPTEDTNTGEGAKEAFTNHGMRSEVKEDSKLPDALGWSTSYLEIFCAVRD